MQTEQGKEFQKQLAHFMACRALLLRVLAAGRVDMQLPAGSDGVLSTLVVLAAPSQNERAMPLLAVLRTSGATRANEQILNVAAHSQAVLCSQIAAWLLTHGWCLTERGATRCPPSQLAYAMTTDSFLAKPGQDSGRTGELIEELWMRDPQPALEVPRNPAHVAGQDFVIKGGESLPCCPICGDVEYETSLYGVCALCAGDIIRTDAQRRLLIEGNKARFVVPDEYPARRVPDPREPDDITDPWELADHRGDPEPELVWDWHDSLARFHADDSNIVVDDVGHTFGPIELEAYSALGPVIHPEWRDDDYEWSTFPHVP